MGRHKAAILFLVLFFGSKAQDRIYLNSNQALLSLIPSFAGSNGFIRSQNLVQNQWPDESGSVFSFASSADAFVRPLNAGIGFSYQQSNFAWNAFRSELFSLSYAQYFKFRELSIIPSLQLSYIERRLDLRELPFFDPNMDPYLFSDESVDWAYFGTEPIRTKSAFDGTAGLLVNFKHFYFGAALFHVNRPDLGLSGTRRLPSRLNLYSAYNYRINTKSLAHFSLQYNYQNGRNNLLANAELLVLKHLLISQGFGTPSGYLAGLGYRGAIGCATINYSNDLGMQYGADFKRKIWQLSLSFTLKKKESTFLAGDFETW